jgi:hypothetical protein
VATIIANAVIKAGPLNAEFDQILAAFNQATGHTHDGSSAEGAYVPLISDTSAFNKVVIDEANNRISFYNDVSSAAVEQIRLEDGVLKPVTDNDIDLGASGLEFKNLYVDGVGYIDTIEIHENATITGDVSVGGNLTVDGNTTLGNASSDTVTVTAQVSSDLVPSGASFDLGSLSNQWDNLWINGTASIDTGTFGTSDTLTINGNSITSTQPLTVSATGVSSNLFLESDRDIYLDAGGGDIRLYAGTQFAKFANNSGNLVIASGPATTAMTFSSANVDFAGTVDVTGNTTLDANLTVDGSTTLGDSQSDSVTFNARIASGYGVNTGIEPTANNTYNLGSDSYEWRNLWIEDTAYIDTGVFGDNEYMTLTDNEIDVSSGGLTIDVTGNLTLDSTTTMNLNTSSDLNIDAASEIEISAGTYLDIDTLDGVVGLQKNGILYAQFTENSGNLQIQSSAFPAVNFTNANADFLGTLDVTGNTTLDSNLSVGGNATITGNLTVNGTTTTVNSTTVTIDDPIFTIGGDTAPASDDNKDRGIEFNWHNGSTAKVGFFGFDDSEGKFTFIPDATNTSEVFSGTSGTIVADLEGNVTGDLDGNIVPTSGSSEAASIVPGVDSTYTLGTDVKRWVDVFADEIHTGSNIQFEGATEDAFETTLTVTDPTADRTVTIPDADGTVALANSLEHPTFTNGADIGNNEFLTFGGETAGSSLGGSYPAISALSNPSDRSNDNLFFYIDGSNRVNINQNEVYLATGMDIVFEGDTSDANQTRLVVEDPTADRTITLPDLDGTVPLINSSGHLVVENADPELHLISTDVGESYFQLRKSFVADAWDIRIDGSNSASGSIFSTTIDNVLFQEQLVSGGLADTTFKDTVTIEPNDLTNGDGSLQINSGLFGEAKIVVNSNDPKIGIGTTSPAVSLDIATTDAIQVPDGTTAERPASPASGMFRYNTDENGFEGYANGVWQPLTDKKQTANTTSTTQTAIATYAYASYVGGEFLITADDGTERTITKLLVVHDGTTAVATQFGEVNTDAALATFDVDISGSNFRILATAASASSTDYTVIATLIDS